MSSNYIPSCMRPGEFSTASLRHSSSWVRRERHSLTNVPAKVRNMQCAAISNYAGLDLGKYDAFAYADCSSSGRFDEIMEYPSIVEELF